MVTFSHTDEGTDEAVWAASGLAAIAELPLAPQALAGMRFVVLAAHPDDETLGAGGLLAQLHTLEADVDVVLCTAGEGSHPHSITVSQDQLATTRVNEFGAALAALGHAGNWSYLGLPDGGLAGHVTEITAGLREALGRHGGPPEQLVIVAPYRADGHTDHNALGEAAAQAALHGGHALLEYPIWYWLWATPAHPEWKSWVRFPLDRAAQEAKAAAMGAHASQVLPLSPQPGDEALLSAEFLRHFDRPFETFAWTPSASVASAPHSSADAERIFDEVHSASEDPWKYTTSWYERRKRALTLAALPQEHYRSGLEIGCSIGTLSLDLADRCTSLLAVDASSTALEHAAARLAPFPGVATRQLTLPGEWPDGTFDLVVVSEVGYYLSPAELMLLLDRIEASLEPGGTLLLCHWRHPVAGWELDGETAHTLVRDRLRWAAAGLYRERDFVLETLVAPRDSTSPEP
ncbi:bifunctional PIG-L family deacetylase/class I SAM-dependent methyltransferase [Arthrobacter sp. BE255]|uniref:bifunctional PIG-L family deacetylase/class I SAM-dependent methyltransferase n=1 Tax=Arthrobacter sp. BE255 TaxID=2817721 RepID=UPI00286AA49F|nr:bifunctional PIG-L family deacetylase/class I SAM-dependent methyltransferase [Arthrobacter sp. BE255]